MARYKYAKPPVKRLLTEYLPTLPVRLRIAGEAKSPPEAVVRLVDRAVSSRNRIAHATGEDVDRGALNAMLDAISDVLWLLDFYRGEAWALDHLSDETRRALGIEDRPAG